jgi:hypothetical protein
MRNPPTGTCFSVGARETRAGRIRVYAHEHVCEYTLTGVKLEESIVSYSDFDRLDVVKAHEIWVQTWARTYEEAQKAVEAVVKEASNIARHRINSLQKVQDQLAHPDVTWVLN